MKKILVINAGSSTIKWKLFNAEDLNVVASGVADRIFVDGFIETSFRNEKYSQNKNLNSHAEASKAIVDDLMKHQIINNLNDVKYLGFRIVQGGSEFDKTTIINQETLVAIEKYKVLAPLHNPGAVQAIKSFHKIFPEAKITGTFDTSFHTTISEVNSTYPIDFALSQKYQIKKYGFHGTSHHYITLKLAKILDVEKVNFVNLHIGNGASLCAIENSQSIDTSMGLTPLAGVMMGTRSGDVDPSIFAYLSQEAKMSIEQINQMLLKNSGIKGVSGISQDLRDVEKAAKSGNKQALFALDLYAQKIADYLAIYLNKVKNPQAIVFTAGVGENSASMREKIISKINILNLSIDQAANAKIKGDYQLISDASSALKIYVIRTDEELMIAQDALKV